MRPNITPETQFGLVLQDGDQPVYCMFKKTDPHPDSLDSGLPPMYLTAPKPVPPGYVYEGGDEITDQTIAFVAFSDTFEEFGDAWNMVLIEVSNPIGEPAIEFVRQHAEGGTVQHMANDLFTACFFKMMDEHKQMLN